MALDEWHRAFIVSNSLIRETYGEQHYVDSQGDPQLEDHHLCLSCVLTTI